MNISKDIDASRLTQAEFEAMTNTLRRNANSRIDESDIALVQNSNAAKAQHQEEIAELVKAYESRISALEAKINEKVSES